MMNPKFTTLKYTCREDVLGVMWAHI